MNRELVVVATSTKRALLITALALMSGGSGAQTLDPRYDEALARERIKESALPADTCLQRSSEMFYYPSAALKGDRSGLVRLALTFRRPDAPPEVELLTLVGGTTFLRAAKERVAQHRMPCLSADSAPVRIVEDIQFTATPEPESHHAAPGPEDPSSPRRQELARCLRTPAQGPIVGDAGDKGANAILQITFAMPDEPPAIKVIYSSGPPALLKAFKTGVSNWRMPCITPQDEPMVYRQQFRYQPDGQRTAISNPLPLPAFLSSVKGIRTMVVKFNFDEMGCPFDVSWQFNMPVMPNYAAQVGPASSYDTRREPFLKWLTTLELDLTPERFERLLGQHTRIQVGCGSLDLSDD